MTVEPTQQLLYSELPELGAKVDVGVPVEVINESEVLEALRKELRDTQKSLQEYRLNEVGRQQQDFIQ